MSQQNAYETDPRQEDTQQETDAKCPACGAAIQFDPATGKLACEYCGYEHAIPTAEDAGSISEMDFSQAEHLGSFAWGVKKKRVSCKSCGAEAIYDELEISAVCPFCGSNHVMEEAAADSLAPGGVCPFEITADQARQNFQKWLKRRLFTPSKAKKQCKANSLLGIYTPYWTFDANTTSNYTANMGRDRRVKRGKDYVTVTDWWRVSGIYQAFIDDELVSASTRHDKNMLKKVEPFDFRKLRPYQSEYVAGFIAERYSVGLAEGWETGKNQMRARLDRDIRRHLLQKHRANRIANLSFSILFENVTYKYLLLPMWLSSYLYKNKVYRFMVNGQTGRVGGSAPVSALRVAIAVVLGLAALAALLYLFSLSNSPA